MEQQRFEHPDPYAAIPELYDLEHATYDDDLDLYRNLARGIDQPILELGCGSGRIVVPLATMGLRVTGLDSSPPMLARAAMAVEAAGVTDRVTLRAGSMVTADRVLAGPFGLVILALNSLLHAATATEQRGTLASARRLLAPGGRLVVDLLNPVPVFLQAMERDVQHEGSWLRADGGRVDKFAARQVFPASQLIETDLWYDVTDLAGGLRRVATSYPLRYLHLAELELLLELVGFSTWQVYGSYDLDHFTDDSDRLLVIAEAERRYVGMGATELVE
jgi:SAM-dependent methyltransferase